MYRRLFLCSTGSSLLAPIPDVHFQRHFYQGTWCWRKATFFRHFRNIHKALFTFPWSDLIFQDSDFCRSRIDCEHLKIKFWMVWMHSPSLRRHQQLSITMRILWFLSTLPTLKHVTVSNLQHLLAMTDSSGFLKWTKFFLTSTSFITLLKFLILVHLEKNPHPSFFLKIQLKYQHFWSLFPVSTPPQPTGSIRDFLLLKVNIFLLQCSTVIFSYW